MIAYPIFYMVTVLYLSVALIGIYQVVDAALQDSPEDWPAATYSDII